VSEDDSDKWVFRHPTVTDAFASVVAGSPELVELYAHGAKLDRLLGEVACSPKASEDGRIRIPPALYPALIERLKFHPLDEALKSFLGARCEKAFLVQMLEARPDILEWAASAQASGQALSGKLLIAALVSWDLLPEGHSHNRGEGPRRPVQPRFFG
jgi:hypothetical protein